MRSCRMLGVAAVVLGLGRAGAADWPQWRGPDRSGVSPEKGLRAAWPKAGPRLLWTFSKGGTGYSAPAVVGGVVYTMGARGRDEYLIALGADGKEKWATKICPTMDFAGAGWNRGPSATPTVAGDLVVALGSPGVVLAVNKADGTALSRKDLARELEGEVNPVGGEETSKFGWGYAWSPLVEDGKVYVTPGGPKGLFAALDARKGTLLWRSTELKDKCTYSSPVAVTLGGTRQLITVVQNGTVAVSAADGKVLWQKRRAEDYGDVVCTTPIVRGNDVYVSVGYNGGADLLRVTGKDGKFSVAPVYEGAELANKQGGVVRLDKHAYGAHEDNNIRCQDFETGKIVWGNKRAPKGAIKTGALAAADGKLFLLDEQGTAAMLEASPAGYKELGKFSLPVQSKMRRPSGKVWTHPVVADGKLFLRDAELLFCYDLRDETPMPAETPRDDLSRADLDALQAARLGELLRRVLPGNRFYARKLAAAGLDPSDLVFPRDLRRLPFTTKDELAASQAEHPPYGEVLSEPAGNYVRLHQTSGTSGKPLRWLDTAESWSWLLGTWLALFRVAGVRPDDRLFFPFSFGPFLGFWTGFEAGARLGCLCLPGGGMSSTARLHFLLEHRATVVLCTPTYALHLAEVARAEGVALPGSAVRAVIVAGEAGGSIPGTRARIEAGWGARVFDHTGMTETGPLGIECFEAPGGLHLLESVCWPEVIDPATGRPVPPGAEGELVVTTFGRAACPLIRYRTGDLVCADPNPCPCGRALVRLAGGIRGRADDMITVRGNNLHPAALQAILHRFPEVAEYRVEVDASEALAALRIDVEPADPDGGASLAARVERVIRDELLFRAEVRTVAPGSLPRAELKARRWFRTAPRGEAPPTS